MALHCIDRLGISIVLCCHNSKDRIVPTLLHLLAQDETLFSWEVVLIDNNSSDGTGQIAANLWTTAGNPCELRIVREETPGTMFARYRGIREARFRYLLFCDDDNWLDSLYVKTAFENITKDSSIGAIGGLGTLQFEHGFTAPEWILKFQKTFGAGPQGGADGDTTYQKGCLYTAGAVLDRAWLDRLYSSGFESSLKGRDGKSLVAGEDTELTYALKLIGGKLHYCSGMHFKHFMPAARMTWPNLKRMWQASGYSDFLISPYKVHFRQGKNRSYVVVNLIHAFQLLVSFLAACGSLFAVGNRHVLKFHRNRGKLKASLFTYQTFKKNQLMVKTLAKNLSGG